MNRRLLLYAHLAGLLYLSTHTVLVPWAVSTGKDTLIIATVSPLALGGIYFTAMAVVGLVQLFTKWK